MAQQPSNLVVLGITLLGAFLYVGGIELYYRTTIRPRKLSIQALNWRTAIEYRWISQVDFELMIWGAGLVAVPPLFRYYRQITGCVWPLFMLIGMIMMAIRGFINRTQLLVTGNTIVIVTAPWPRLSGAKQTLTQVKEVNYAKGFSQTKRSRALIYRFSATTAQGQTVTILDIVDREQDAVKIQQAIQSQLQRAHRGTPLSEDREVDTPAKAHFWYNNR